MLVSHKFSFMYLVIWKILTAWAQCIFWVCVPQSNAERNSCCFLWCDAEFLQCSLEQGNKCLGFWYPTWVDYGEGGSFSLQKMSFVGVVTYFFHRAFRIWIHWMWAHVWFVLTNWDVVLFWCRCHELLFHENIKDKMQITMQ